MNTDISYPLFWLFLALIGGGVFALLFWPRLQSRAQRGRGLMLWAASVALALGIYALLGSPGLVQRNMQSETARRMAAESLGRLEAAVRAAPNDPAAWEALGDGRLNAGQPGLAVIAYKRLAVLTGGAPDALLRLGKAQIIAHGGRVSDEAARTFTMLQSLAPNPQAELFLAMHEAEKGDRTLAKKRLDALANNDRISKTIRAAAREQMKQLR